MRRLIAVAVAVLLLVAGCTRSGSGTSVVQVGGDPGALPTVRFQVPLAVTAPSSRVVWAGTGNTLVDGKPVLIDYLLENASTGAVVAESYGSSPKAYLLTKESLGADLFDALRGQRVGARIVQESPASAAGGMTFPTVIVMDVLATRAEGDPVPARPGMPAVTLAADGAPTITPTTSAPPTDLTVVPLVKGTGDQVPTDARVTVQYTEVDWATGAVVDSTWTTGMPVSFSLAGLGAWSQGLVEQTVGSQVMVVVPPSFALGGPKGSELQNATLVFVVDILAATGPTAAASPSTTVSPSAAASSSPTS
ncbi:FK506-binding protein [mine drainage metagenome]|uniref:FK506-binding protein n=1 Tax=mine drainage metagenome TaxID=410659 RepID=A0A1J5R7J8_9ZZZZ